MMDCEFPSGMIHVSLILDHTMGMKYAEEPFNMGGFFYYLRRPSKWVHFQTPNTHIKAFLYWSLPPPSPTRPGRETEGRTNKHHVTAGGHVGPY